MNSPIAYPLGAPKLTGSTLTVDAALNQPQLITQRIADLTKQKFIVDKVFASSGFSVAGGAVLYEVAAPGNEYLSRDIEAVAPGNEYPIVSSGRPETAIANAEDYGGKFFVSDAAKIRNDKRVMDRDVTALANTIVRKVNTRTVATIEAALTKYHETGENNLIVTGHSWTDAITVGPAAELTPSGSLPAADFATAQWLADIDEMGLTFDLWIVHPNELKALKIAYGSELEKVLASNGIELFSTNRMAPGTAYAVDTGEVGFISYEQGLTTETWREQKTKRTWVQSWAIPLMGVSNPQAIRKFTGLAA
ncbi:major capsid protein [Williamsia sp. 1135]|uniref:major capsid protein n=1 Tax=Williamsia sp. 1135 TaxID=1889262 RepID=UPI000A1122FC|nr:major capsid protein [Williamsia sp. 1135]ORM38178.1 hypothetical protein BFL43_00930 [Williamsia sp. 1135]